MWTIQHVSLKTIVLTLLADRSPLAFGANSLEKPPCQLLFCRQYVFKNAYFVHFCYTVQNSTGLRLNNAKQVRLSYDDLCGELWATLHPSSHRFHMPKWWFTLLIILLCDQLRTSTISRTSNQWILSIVSGVATSFFFPFSRLSASTGGQTQTQQRRLVDCPHLCWFPGL